MIFAQARAFAATAVVLLRWTVYVFAVWLRDPLTALVAFWRLLRLMTFALLLLPAALPLIAFSSRGRTVRYGPLRRQTFDVHLPACTPRGTVVFIPGGAFVVGYKLWGLPLARALNRLSIAVVLVDVRQYPAAACSAQISDARMAIEAALVLACAWGGSADTTHVVGQSAGAHLAAGAIMEMALSEALLAQEAAGATTQPPQRVAARPVRRLVCLSGPFELEPHLVPHFAARGIPLHVIESVFEGRVARFSLGSHFTRLAALRSAVNAMDAELLLPLEVCHASGSSVAAAEGDAHLLASAPLSEIVPPASGRGGGGPAGDRGRLLRTSSVVLATRTRVDVPCFMPPCTILHGTADETIPPLQAAAFAQALAEGGVDASLHYYADETHTSLIIEGALSGARDVFAADLARLIEYDMDVDRRARLGGVTPVTAQSPTGSGCAVTGPSAFQHIAHAPALYFSPLLHPRVAALAQWVNPF